MRDKKLLVLSSFLLTIFSIVMTSLLPVYIGKLVDAMIDFNSSNSTLVVKDIWLLFIILIGLRVLSLILKELADFLIYCCNSQLITKVAADVIYKVQRFNSHWHESSFSGGTMRKITRGMGSVSDINFSIFMNLLPALVVILSIVLVLLFKMPLIALAVGFLFVIYSIISVFMSVKILRPVFKKYFEVDTRFNSQLSDIITGNEIVKSFGAEKFEDNLMGDILREHKKTYVISFKKISIMSFLRNSIDIFIYVVVVSLSIWMWREGKSTPGDIAFIISAVALISGYFGSIGRDVSNMQRTINEMGDIVDIWLRDDDVKDIPDAKKLEIATAPREDKIVFDKVTFGYPNTDKNLFEKFSVKIKSGEKLALVGTSGSGKSTFIKLIQRLYNLNGGAVYIDGQDISKVTLESLRQSISLVPQDPILFHRSLKDNIAYGKPEASMEEIIEASKKAFAHDFISVLPKGYDTLVGERGVKLSGGERQRVAIARAILADKPILILDEATSSLDSVSENYIKQAMEELMKGRTTITIAHRLSTVRKSDRILVFDKGEIIEQGKHDELISQPNSQYKKLYDTQALGISVRDNGE